MDALSDPNTHTVVVPKCAQAGSTEILGNAIGYYIDQDPAPILVIQPSLEMGEAWSKDRLAPMLRDTPALRGKVQDARSRDSKNTLRHKVFPGGHVTIVGANAPAGLASRPIRVVLADEVDRYPVSAGTEGDPLKLAAKRQTTFWNRKTLIGSTPTLKLTSVVWREWLRSDQRKYFVPCPHCEHPQVLRWAQVRWDKLTTGGHIVQDVPEGVVVETHRPDTAQYLCEACGTYWNDGERWEAVRKGEWRATAPFDGIAGFHINGFLSSWVTLAEIVKEFLDAKQHPELLQVWVNTTLGEPWEEKGERIEPSALISRAEAYDANSLPDQVLAITAGVDVQGDRLELQLIGWGENEESWPFLYEVARGDPAQSSVWEEIDDLLLGSYHTQDGRVLRVRAGCIDTGGHHAAAVYAFSRQRRLRRIFPTKGAPGPRPIWPKRASRAGVKGSENVFVIGVDTAKDAIYGRLRIHRPGPGFVHFPSDAAFDADYFDQLTAEHVVTRFRQGRPFREWICPKGRRNEVLDTYVLALAARASLPGRLERRLEYADQAKRSRVAEETSISPAAPEGPALRPPMPMSIASDPYL